MARIQQFQPPKSNWQNVGERPRAEPSSKKSRAPVPHPITMPAMPTAYVQLLEATIRHLQDLQEHGVRHVTVSPETLRELAQPAARAKQPTPARRSPIADHRSTAIEQPAASST